MLYWRLFSLECDGGCVVSPGGGGGIVKHVFRGVCKILETETARYMKLARYFGTIPTE